MTSTYSTSLRLELMGTGDQSGTWGVTNNTNLGTLLEQAITGVLSKAMADTDQTLTNVNGASDEARNAVVETTGALTGAKNVIVPTVEKLYLIKNSCTGGFSVTVKTSAGTGVAVVPGTNRWVYCDGTNVVDGGINLQTLTASALSPTTTDGLALGTTALMWSDLFLASGGVINWNNGDVLITHSANTLAHTGASSGYTFDAVVKASADDAAALGASGTAWSDLFLASGGVINFNAGDVTITHSANLLAFAGASSGYTFDAAVKPATSDGAALGTTALMWSDLFLAAGGVINWNNGGATVTYSSGSDTLSFASAANGYYFDAPVALTGNITPAGGRLISGAMGSSEVGFLTQASGIGGCIPAVFYNVGGSIVGQITSSNTATTYATSSDPRLKDNVEDLEASGVYIDALRPRTWLWKDGSYGCGFLSTEFAEVNPRAVKGGPDAVDETGKPIYQSLDASTPETMAHIVRELQLLRRRCLMSEQRVIQLEAQISALK